MVSHSREENFINNVFVEIHHILIGLFEHQSRVEMLHIENESVDLLKHKFIQKVQLLKFNLR